MCGFTGARPFQSTLSMRRATRLSLSCFTYSLFQSTLSMRRATRPHPAFQHRPSISIHALHEESDMVPSCARTRRHISIHALHEESDQTAGAGKLTTEFQSTLSMRRATRVPHGAVLKAAHISIHALHEESDLRCVGCTVRVYISIHALHEESDSAAGHFCPLFETQASCLALSISNNTADTTNNMSKTSNWLSVSF